jgi:WD40 repeat protein
VAGTQEGKIVCWDAASGAREPIKAGVAHAAAITGLRFGRTLLASSSLDGPVKLWRVESGIDLERPIVLSDRPSWIWAIALSPADDRVFSAAADRRVQSWVTRTESLADEVCSRVADDLTPQQWNDYVSDKFPYQRACPERSAGSNAR